MSHPPADSLQQADVFMRQQRYADALPLLETFTVDHPHQADAFHNRSYALENWGSSPRPWAALAAPSRSIPNLRKL